MINYIKEKFTNILPVFGGSAGAVYQVNATTFFPAWEVIVSSIVVAIIGACIGYLVKLFLDLIFQHFKDKHHLK